MKRLVVGILAHVDAGKTTLSEGMLYTGGSIRKVGRVDNGDAFLDTYALEKKRGITIFSKQAILKMEDLSITLLDTPGHVDFSAEMERTLQVLDYAILVISGADGVQGHTQTLFRLLQKYRIPVFLFINKMDQPGTDREARMEELKDCFGDGCVDFTDDQSEAFFENIAMCEETALDEFLAENRVSEEKICAMIARRKVFPCFFGSALKLEGVQEFLDGIRKYACVPESPEDFGARVFKIMRDETGKRLTFLKVTGGSLPVKTVFPELEEKADQIRIYSGDRYETVDEAKAGMVCAVTGLTKTVPGMGLGTQKGKIVPVLEPVLTYRLILPEEVDAAVMLKKLRLLEEEEPELHVGWNEKTKDILIKVMGEVQIEVLKTRIEERFGVSVDFGTGHIVYRETIADTVEGVGHFEPLRHYAEVHLRLKPGEEGSGLSFFTECSEDMLAKNWQRLVLTHLKEKEHVGVLTGSPITDMKITLVAGRAHVKHTEGGDFRQATYRALRQGLMQAKSVLLEPWYDFRLEIPEELIGRAMTDIDRRYGTMQPPETKDGKAYLSGSAPVAAMQDYAKDVTAYTRGRGRLSLTLAGYRPCHNAEEVIGQIGYDPEADLLNPTGSVFCAHGAGFIVPWQEVKNYMHIESREEETRFVDPAYDGRVGGEKPAYSEEEWLDPEEIDAILDRTYHANKKESNSTRKWGRPKSRPVNADPVVRSAAKKVQEKEYLLVDGYNVIFAWDELNELAKVNLDGARGKLLDILCDYQGIRGCELIVVFDAYRVAGHPTEISDYHNIHVVFTKEAETADQFIEKFAHENGRRYRVTVATSDGLEQIIIRGAGCALISSRELEAEIADAKKRMNENYVNHKAAQVQEKTKTYLLDDLDEKMAEQIQKIREDGDLSF